MPYPRIPGGYIIIHRELTESMIWDKPPLYIKVWLYLLAKAQHSQYKGLKRGQLYTNIPEIIEACSWYVGFRKEKPNKDQIYQIINWLRNGHEADYEGDTKATMITTRKATQGLLINIVNYDFYQNPRNYESNAEQDNEEITKATREQREPNNTNKNDNNAKNDNNVLSIVNNAHKESLEDIKEDFKRICNEFYAEFSTGRWTKDQWKFLIDKYVEETINENRYVNVKKNKRRSYVYKSLKNIAYKHDFGNQKITGAEPERNTDVYYNWLIEDQ